jgi:hypothetical protein
MEGKTTNNHEHHNDHSCSHDHYEEENHKSKNFDDQGIDNKIDHSRESNLQTKSNPKKTILFGSKTDHKNPVAARMIELNDFSMIDNVFSVNYERKPRKKNTLKFLEASPMGKLLFYTGNTSKINIFNGYTPAMERKLSLRASQKCKQFNYSDGQVLRHGSDKETMRVTLNQNLINLRKKSSGSVLKHIIELHSGNHGQDACKHTHDGPLLQTAKTFNKSISSN